MPGKSPSTLDRLRQRRQRQRIEKKIQQKRSQRAARPRRPAQQRSQQATQPAQAAPQARTGAIPPPNAPVSRPTKKLSRIFKFSPGDLRANRQGLLSKRQYLRHKQNSNSIFWFALVLFLATFSVAAFLLIHVAIGDIGQILPDGVYELVTADYRVAGLALLITVAIPLFFGQMLVKAVMVRNALKKAEVKQYRGAVRKIKDEDSEELTVWVGRDKFTLNQKRFEALSEGIEYVIYYLPHHDTNFESIEVIG
jgi:hypothetical protein